MKNFALKIVRNNILEVFRTLFFYSQSIVIQYYINFFIIQLIYSSRIKRLSGDLMYDILVEVTTKSSNSSVSSSTNTTLTNSSTLQSSNSTAPSTLPNQMFASTIPPFNLHLQQLQLQNTQHSSSLLQHNQSFGFNNEDNQKQLGNL